MHNSIDKNRGTHGVSSFMLGGLPSSRENPQDLSVGECQIIENLKQQIYAVNAVRMAIECCNANENCLECPYFGKGCIDELLKDALAIAEAYRRVLASGMEMMEKK